MALLIGRCSRVGWVSGSALVLALLVAVAWPVEARAQAGELDRAGQRLFQNYTRVFCRQFFHYEDRFIMLPNHYRRREASTGKTYDQVVEEMTWVEQVRAGGNVIREITHRPPRGEAIAASLVIPELEVGHYGYIDAVTIERIVRDNEMIVRDVRLIDPEIVGSDNNTHRLALVERQRTYEGKTYRLHGFSTAGLREGQLYRGPDEKGIHIAVAGVDQHHNFVFINFERLRRIRTNEFEDALAYVDLSPAEFNDLTRGNREEHGVQGDMMTMIALYNHYYTAFRIPRPAVTPSVSDAPATADPPAEPATPDQPEVPDTPDTPDRPDRPDAPGSVFPDLPEGEEVPDLPEALEPVDDSPADDPGRDEDDWDEDWTPPPPPSTDEPGFFGIPLE
ncbi:MAG: hypothetical protein ACIAXF_13735 [Phycisphaerales bacterium JB063]